MSYPQYPVPAVVVQSVIFVALLTADRTTIDHLLRLDERFATLPIAAAVPVGACMVAALIRAALALSVAMVAGYALGFRTTGGLGYALAFVLMSFLLCLALALGADALGSSTSSIQGVSQYPRSLSCSCSCCPPESRRRRTFPIGSRPATAQRLLSQVVETPRGLATGQALAGQLGGQPDLVCGHGAGLRLDPAAVAEANPVIPQAGTQGSLLIQTWPQAGRLLTRAAP